MDSFHALGWIGGSWAWHGAFWLLSSTSRLLLLTFPRKLIIVLEHPCKFTQFSCMLCEGKRWVQINTWVQLQSREKSWPASQSRQVPSPNGPIFIDVTLLWAGSWKTTFTWVCAGEHEHGEGSQFSSSCIVRPSLFRETLKTPRKPAFSTSSVWKSFLLM